MKRQLESVYKTKLRKKLAARYPGCVVINNDPTDNQGVSDLCVLYNTTWAMLEGKRDKHSSYRPNQKYYIDKFNSMSFSSVIYPENEEEVLEALDEYFDFVDIFQIKKQFDFYKKKGCSK